LFQIAAPDAFVKAAKEEIHMATVERYKLKPGETIFGGGKGDVSWRPYRNKTSTAAHQPAPEPTPGPPPTVLQSTGNYQLALTIQPTPYGHHLKFSSFVPTARRPQEQLRFQLLLAREDMRALHQALGRALEELPAG
jgi:hypothetical protein